MPQETITIEVPEEVARAYKKASPSDRQRVKRAVTVSLMSREDAANQFREITERASKHAAKRGLTPEKLNDLLREDDE